MHSLPLWFTVWQSLDSLLAIALDSAVIYPFMMLVCLVLTRRQRQPGVLARSGRIFTLLAMITAMLGLLDILARAIIDLCLFPAVMKGLVVPAFDPLSAPWLSSTSTILLWLAGLLLVSCADRWSRPVYLTCGMETDADTQARMQRLATISAICSFLAFLCFFASIISRNWPFLGLPEQMTEGKVFTVLLAHAWRTNCASFMPAGALAVLTFFLLLPPLEQSGQGSRENQNIPGSTPEEEPLQTEESTALRMSAAFAIAGAVFQFLDASFIAFSRVSGMGLGLRSALMQYGPFLATGLSLACWVFLFARPRRKGFVLALLPVLLLLFRSMLHI